MISFGLTMNECQYLPSSQANNCEMSIKLDVGVFFLCAKCPGLQSSEHVFYGHGKVATRFLEGFPVAQGLAHLRLVLRNCQRTEERVAEETARLQFSAVHQVVI